MSGSPADTSRTVHIAEVKHYALKLLRYRPRSKRELRSRLKMKGFELSQINSTIESLENAGLIQDESLVSMLLKNALERKNLGRKGIEAFLSRRGIDRDLRDKTLSEVSDDMEKEAALRLVKKKLKVLQNCPEDKLKQRLWGMLQRRGFSANVISSALKSLKETQINTDKKHTDNRR